MFLHKYLAHFWAILSNLLLNVKTAVANQIRQHLEKIGLFFIPTNGHATICKLSKNCHGDRTTIALKNNESMLPLFLAGQIKSLFFVTGKIGRRRKLEKQ